MNNMRNQNHHILRLHEDDSNSIDVNAKLTPEEKKYVAKLIHVFRKLKQVKDQKYRSDLYYRMDAVNPQIRSLCQIVTARGCDLGTQHYCCFRLDD